MPRQAGVGRAGVRPNNVEAEGGRALVIVKEETCAVFNGEGVASITHPAFQGRKPRRFWEKQCEAAFYP